MIAAERQADASPGPARAAGPTRSDALLQAARRVDWRFLLDDPSLGHVVYLGAPDEPLLEGLRLLGASLTMLPRQGGAGAFDLVVARNPSPAMLAAAVALLRPGGRLYVEVDGHLSRQAPSGALPSAPACAAALRSYPVGVAALHWHWPSFAACTRIVPLTAAALRYAVGAAGSGAPAALARALGPLLRPGLVAELAPHVSLVACRQPSDEEGQRP